MWRSRPAILPHPGNVLGGVWRWGGVADFEHLEAGRISYSLWVLKAGAAFLALWTRKADLRVACVRVRSFFLKPTIRIRVQGPPLVPSLTRVLRKAGGASSRVALS